MSSLVRCTICNHRYSGIRCPYCAGKAQSSDPKRCCDLHYTPSDEIELLGESNGTTGFCRCGFCAVVYAERATIQLECPLKHTHELVGEGGNAKAFPVLDQQDWRVRERLEKSLSQEVNRG